MAAPTHELGLFRAPNAVSQPRDGRGRFVRVKHTPARLHILRTARALRDAMGLQDDPRFAALDRYDKS